MYQHSGTQYIYSIEYSIKYRYLYCAFAYKTPLRQNTYMLQIQKAFSTTIISKLWELEGDSKLAVS